MTGRIVVVGPLNIDFFIRGSAPTEVEELNRWVGPSEVEVLVAGSIGYTVQDLALLGWEVSVVSNVAEDGFGQFIASTLTDKGLDTRFLGAVPGESTMAIYVMLFGGAKRPMTYRLGDYPPWPEPIPPRILDPLPDVIHSGGLLHFPGMWHRSLPVIFALARQQGVTTSIDPQFPLVDTPTPWLPHIEDVLVHCDILLVDEGEGGSIFGVSGAEAVVEAAHDLGIRTVAVKRGGEGSVVSDGRHVLIQPAVPVGPALIRDAVGAGDAFDSGFLTALHRGDSLAEAARFATATATLTLTGRGGSESLDSAEHVAEMMARVEEPKELK